MFVKKEMIKTNYFNFESKVLELNHVFNALNINYIYNNLTFKFEPI